MMYKGKIKLVNGSIVLPTLGRVAKKNGDIFDLDKDHFYNEDIQMALLKGIVEFKSKIPPVKFKNIKNISTANLRLGKYGLLEAGASMKVFAELNSDIKQYIQKGLIKFVNKLTAKEVKGNKSQIFVLKPESDLIIDTDRKNDEDEHGGISFVDLNKR